MAQYGIQPGDRGTLMTHWSEDGIIEGRFIPKEAPSLASGAAQFLSDGGVTLVNVSPSERQMTIYPTDTRPNSESFLGPKYSKIRSIIMPADVDPHVEVADILDTLPAGFIKDPEYGLGLTKECDVLVNLIEESTNCTAIEFISSGDSKVEQNTFFISFARFNSLRRDLASIKSRGDHGIRRVKETHVHNSLAGLLGLKPRQLTLGVLTTSKWMTKVAAGEEPLNIEEQDTLLDATTKHAAQIASAAPEKMVRLQRDINLVNLERLIGAYDTALQHRHNENWWQKFFEENVFVLQLLFGGPTAFVGAQVPIGDGAKVAKGKKIADYLFKNALTNNAALVEIKKPTTKLMKKRPYRHGVYGVQSEIAEAVTQVLDQALQLTRYETATKERTGDATWASNAPRCFVVAGHASKELTTEDRKKSFDLYREYLSNVRIVTYDEVLGQLETLRDFLSSESSIESKAGLTPTA